MLRNLIAAAIGWLVTFLFLVAWNATAFMDPIPAFAVAALIGSLGGILWPAIVGFFLVRRARRRREAEIEEEVTKRVAEQQK